MDNENPRLSGRMIAVWMSAGSLLVALVLLVVGWLQPGNLSSDAVAILLTHSTVPTGVWIAVILAVAMLFSAFAIWERANGERRGAKLAREKSDVEQELRHTRSMLAYTGHLMVTDPITGIPNFRSWQLHAAAWPTTQGAQKPSCLILIDLDNLGALNDVSHECANKVLELFATQTYDSMRRNEHAFKIPDKDAPREVAEQVEMFRHYAGGDEFCFHMIDDVNGAIGFVNRLSMACRRYEAEIKRDILPKFMKSDQIADYRLQFCAAIVPMKPGAAPDIVISSALKLLTHAKKHETSRLLMQFDPQSPCRTLDERKAEIDAEISVIGKTLESINRETSSEDPDSKASRLEALNERRTKLQEQSSMLGRAGPNFLK